MKLSKFFNWFCIVALVSLGGLGFMDLIFFMLGGSGDTLSYKFWILSKTWPLIPYLLGFLTGHLVWQYNPDSISPPQAK